MNGHAVAGKKQLYNNIVYYMISLRGLSVNKKTAFKTYCIALPYCAYKPKRFYSTKLDSEINAPFPSNEHGDSDFFQNSLKKNKFEEEKN